MDLLYKLLCVIFDEYMTRTITFMYKCNNIEFYQFIVNLIQNDIFKKESENEEGN